MSSQSIVTLLLGIVEIVSFSIMSRLLSKEDFGYFAAVTAITTVFSSFSETGIGSAIIQKKEIDEEYINNSFTISFIFGLSISLLLFILAKPLSILVADKSLTIPLMFMSLTLICNCLSSVNTSLMHRRYEFFLVGLINLVSLVVTTIIAITLALKGFGYYAIISKAVITSLMTLLLSWIFAKVKFRFDLNYKTFKSIFSFSGWLMASVFLRNLAQQLDKLLMSNLLSVTSLGAYNRPKDFINTIASKLGGIFDTALFPVLSQLQDNLESMRNAYLKSLFFLNLASVVLASAFIFNGELFIRVFFGEEWLHIINVFQVLAVALVFNFDARLADCYLRSLGWTKLQFKFRIFEVCVKVIALLIGYRWGILGVAWSVLISNMLTIFVKHIYIALYLNIKLSTGFIILLKSWRVLVLCIPIMLLSMSLCPQTFWGNVVNAIIYTLLMVIIFIFLPDMVGTDYKKGPYTKIITVIKSKI